MDTTITIKDMPKLESPFVRDKGICTPVIASEHRWAFTDEAVAVDKVDGTNTSILVRDGHIIRMFNRGHQVSLFTQDSVKFYSGITNSVEKGRFIPGDDGQFFGELIGPGVEGNPYQSEVHQWLPFSYLKEKYHYKFWSVFVKGFKTESDEGIYNIVSDLFKNLWSVYKNQIGIKGRDDVNEEVGFRHCAAEGIVFHHPDGRMCKLRRNMFPWFTGKGKRKS